MITFLKQEKSFEPTPVGIDIRTVLRLDLQVLVSVFLENVSAWTGNTIYRKGFLDKYNLRYTKGRILAQDVEFEFKALFHARSVSSVNEVLSFLPSKA